MIDTVFEKARKHENVQSNFKKIKSENVEEQVNLELPNLVSNRDLDSNSHSHKKKKKHTKRSTGNGECNNLQNINELEGHSHKTKPDTEQVRLQREKIFNKEEEHKYEITEVAENELPDNISKKSKRKSSRSDKISKKKKKRKSSREDKISKKKRKSSREDKISKKKRKSSRKDKISKKKKKSSRKVLEPISNDSSIELTLETKEVLIAPEKKMKKKERKHTEIMLDDSESIIFEPNEISEVASQTETVVLNSSCSELTLETEEALATFEKRKKKNDREHKVTTLNDSTLFDQNEISEVPYQKETVNCDSDDSSFIDDITLNDDTSEVNICKDSLLAYHKKKRTDCSKISHVKKRKQLIKEDISGDERLEKLCDDITIEWEMPILHTYPKLNVTREFIATNGISVRTGRWSREEEIILKNNWEKFKAEYNFDNPSSLLGLRRNGDGQKKSVVNFVRYLGKGLDDRPLISIYQQARRMMDPNNYKGSFLDEEERMVFQLVAKHGRKWEKIGRILGRSGMAVYDVWRRLIHRDKHKGSWDKEEDERLLQALTIVTGSNNLKKISHHYLPWTKISKIVGTRSPRQCMSHWLEYLINTYNPNEIGDGKWTVENKIQLLNILNDNGYLTDNDVPWEDLAKELGLPSCSIMRKKWNNLKTKVPRYYVKTFRELLDWLITYHMPILMAKTDTKAF